jgi:hypothetical protein
MKNNNLSTVSSLVILIILILIYFFAKNKLHEENKERIKIIENNIKVTGTIEKYHVQLYKGNYTIINYSFKVNNIHYLIKGYQIKERPFPTCERDNSCIGRNFSVYYLPENPKKYHVPVFEEEIKF